MPKQDEEKKRKRRIRSPHPGVVLTKRTWSSGAETWFARWFDPDTGKRKDTNLNKLDKTNAESRKNWAVKKSKQLAARRADIEAGVAPKTTTGITKAYENYLEARAAELSPDTIRNYREALAPLMNWCKHNGVEIVEDLTPPRLAAFREAHIRVTARVAKSGRGASRGANRESEQRRSPHTVNRVFRSARTLLSYWRRKGITPALDSDAIRDSLAYMKSPKPLPTYLKTAEVQALLSACIEHDKAAYVLTRDEHAKGLKKGSTARYAPITLFVYAALLTGARFDELRTLQWSDVDLDQQMILIRSEAAKLDIARRIDLSVSPSLGSMLAELKDAGGRFVFGNKRPFARTLIESARKRLIRKHDLNHFTCHDLRRTCGTFLTCAPGIYGGASAFMSAKRLGHSVAVAEKHYLGVVTNVPAQASTLESAMDIDELVPSLREAVLSRRH